MLTWDWQFTGSKKGCGEAANGVRCAFPWELE